MTSSTMDDFDGEISDDESGEMYGIRDGTLFIIDATPPMFVEDTTDGISYFLKCIQQYKDILSQKLVWNRQDWVGLILFGTEKWDMDPEAENILTIQKLNPVVKDNIKEIMQIEEGKWKYYKNMSSSTAYPLCDVLQHAAHMFSTIKVTMPKRRVILFTCQDDPPMTDNTEKHRIRVRAQSYNDIGLQLYVVGLGEKWNHSTFYKDLEMLSRKIDVDDYKRTTLESLVEQVKLPSRIMAKLPWHLGENVTLDVTIQRFNVKREYLKKESMSKETNAPLITHSYLRIATDTRQESTENEESPRPLSPVLETEIRKYQEFGLRKIYFTPAEVKSLSAIRQQGIELICLKPIFYHPIYHFEAPYFLTYRESNRKDNKLLFGAVLDKCNEKGRMIICAVTIRKESPTHLCTMIPNVERGGFFLYKIPFRENVRDLNQYLENYIYNDVHNVPTSPDDVELLEKIIKKLRIKYNPELFPNPKLNKQLQTVESLALDLEQGEPLEDYTLPLNDEMREKVQDLLLEYKNVFKEQEDGEDKSSSKKKFKRSNGKPIDSAALEDDKNVCQLIKENKIESCTVAQLKSILQSRGLKTSSKKETLIKKIKEYFEETS